MREQGFVLHSGMNKNNALNSTHLLLYQMAGIYFKPKWFCYKSHDTLCVYHPVNRVVV